MVAMDVADGLLQIQSAVKIRIQICMASRVFILVDLSRCVRGVGKGNVVGKLT